MIKLKIQTSGDPCPRCGSTEFFCAWEVDALIRELKNMIRDLLGHLPNSEHPNDESWDWCWNELSGDAQDACVEVAVKARKVLG